MPSHLRALTRNSAADVVENALEATPQQMTGVELEWPVHRRGNAAQRPSHGELLEAVAAPLPHGSRVTVEPGGQIELSTLPTASADAALDVAAADATALHRQLDAAGLAVAELAVDTRRAPQRILDAPRYAAMEHFFTARGAAGKWMMCNTAALQINLGHHPLDPNRRWALAHRLGPVLIATFANSPGLDMTGQRWESLRQAIWFSIDPGRTRPPSVERPCHGTWLQYALSADVMLIRPDDGSAALAMEPGLSFGQWLTEGHVSGWPTADDLRYHLTTLFPPVRPGGWLELRMIDALPAHLREVAVLVVLTALTTDVSHKLEERLPGTEGLWYAAARYGLAHPLLHVAAHTLFDTVVPNLGLVTGVARRREAVQAFLNSHIRPGVSPAQQTDDTELCAIARPPLQLDTVSCPALIG